MLLIFFQMALNIQHACRLAGLVSDIDYILYIYYIYYYVEGQELTNNISHVCLYGRYQYFDLKGHSLCYSQTRWCILSISNVQSLCIFPLRT